MRNPSATATSPGSVSQNVWLEVRRGRTRSPRRPVNGHRFLIGAGSNCQLQLGGPDIPILHSILLVEDEGAHIDSVVAVPQLYVNGRPQRSADLHNGDVFSIGRFEFQVHVPPHADPQTAARQELPLHQPPADVREMSAAQLVAQIEAEEQLVDEFQSAREQGAQALLDAARRRRTAALETAGSTAAAAGTPVAGSSDIDPSSSGELVISFPNVASAEAESENILAASALTLSRRAS